MCMTCTIHTKNTTIFIYTSTTHSNLTTPILNTVSQMKNREKILKEK